MHLVAKDREHIAPTLIKGENDATLAAEEPISVWGLAPH